MQLVDDLPMRYRAALRLVHQIEGDLGGCGNHYAYGPPGTRIYRDWSGQLLTTLDEVVRAILDDNLMPFDEAAAWVQWVEAELPDQEFLEQVLVKAFS